MTKIDWHCFCKQYFICKNKNTIKQNYIWTLENVCATVIMFNILFCVSGSETQKNGTCNFQLCVKLINKSKMFGVYWADDIKNIINDNRADFARLKVNLLHRIKNDVEYLNISCDMEQGCNRWLLDRVTREIMKSRGWHERSKNFNLRPQEGGISKRGLLRDITLLPLTDWWFRVRRDFHDSLQPKKW